MVTNLTHLTVCLCDGQAKKTNGACMCDVTPFDGDGPRERASLLTTQQRMVDLQSGSELYATLSCPKAVPER